MAKMYTDPSHKSQNYLTKALPAKASTSKPKATKRNSATSKGASLKQIDTAKDTIKRIGANPVLRGIVQGTDANEAASIQSNTRGTYKADQRLEKAKPRKSPKRGIITSRGIE